MQVVILCGGMGTRIRDVADDVPKPMIPIGERPIIWHIMNSYAQYGFRHFVLCLGYKSWVIKQFFLNYGLASSDLTLEMNSSRPVKIHNPAAGEDWKVTLVETGLNTMTGGRVKQAAPYIESEHFLLTYGDGLSDIDICKLVDFHLAEGRIGTVTAVQPPGRFGEIEVERHRVIEFNEKPPQSRGRISGGFFAFHRSFLDRLSDSPSLILEREPLIDLARDGQLSAYLHDGFWSCMDSSRDYQHLNQLWASGNAPWSQPVSQRRLPLAA